MKNFKLLFDYILPISVIVNLVLLYSVYTLPKNISEELSKKQGYIKDTIIKVVPDKLTNVKDFVYFEGEIIKSYNISERYQFNPSYPKEFWEGYLNLAVSNNGGKYFIWSKSKIDNTFLIKGYFYTSNGKWQEEKDYLNLLVPVVSR